MLSSSSAPSCTRLFVSRASSVLRLCGIAAIACLGFGGTHASLAQSISFNGVQSTLATGLSAPEGVAADDSGDVYVADAASGRVWKVTSAASGLNCSTTGSCAPVGSGLGQPAGIAVDGSRNVYVSDLATQQVIKVSPNGAQVTIATGLTNPTGVAVDASGNVYVGSGTTIVKVAAAGGQSTVVSGLVQAAGVAVDSNLNLYVADRGANEVLKISSGGVQTVLATGLNAPAGVAVDGAGTVYVADNGGNRLWRLPPSGSNLNCAVAGACLPLGQSTSAPTGVAIDRSGTVYFAAGGQLARVAQDMDFGSLPVGSTSATAQTLLFTLAGTDCSAAHTVSVVTKGAAAKDFTESAGSEVCTPGTPTAYAVTISFTPLFAGLRTGAVELTDASGTVQSILYLHGVGTGPQVTWIPGVISKVTP